MRVFRIIALLLGSLAMASLGCGKKGHSASVHGDAVTTAPAPPTPDTTPIASLRTPAGWLLLKAERAAPTATPAAAGAANQKP